MSVEALVVERRRGSRRRGRPSCRSGRRRRRRRGRGETAVRASSSSVASLSTAPSSRSTPQWPWSVYSHRHTSVITSRSGCASLIARVASCTTPSSSQAPEPSASLSVGDAEQQHGRDAERAQPRRPPRPRPRSTGARRRASRRSARGPSRPASTNSGGTKSPAIAAASRARGRAGRGVRAQPAQAGCGKGHRVQGSAGSLRRRAVAGRVSCPLVATCRSCDASPHARTPRCREPRRRCRRVRHRPASGYAARAGAAPRREGHPLLEA